MEKYRCDNKTRILALERVFMAADKPMLCTEIQAKLYNRYHITVALKTLYDDIAALTAFENVQYKHRVGYWMEKAGENNE